MKVALIDNYDSFVYNLAQYLGAAGAEVEVLRNHVDVDEVEELSPDAVVISPGPGRPEQAGCSVEIVRRLGPHLPVLGVCLGHQAIGAAFGASIVRAQTVMHGKTSKIQHSSRGVLRDLPDPFEATRYHSLVIDPATVPEEIEITATTEDGAIMGVAHRDFPIQGVQFHPESVLTAEGMRMVENFLTAVG